MDGPLYVDARDSRGLWRVIFAHTRCARATAQILRDLTDAREEGPISRCVISPPVPGAARWGLLFSRAALSPELQLDR